jgi:hypothetical protein
MTNIQKGILELHGRPVEIPDCSMDDLPQFFIDMGYKVGAEIGVYKGAFTEKFCKAGLRVYGIDPWIAYNDYPLINSSRRAELQYEKTKKTLAPYSNCTIIRKTSMDALKDIPDGSLDFCYIDANHLFRYVADDIVEWSRKIKKSGVIAGHDFYDAPPSNRGFNCHVKQVVNAYTQAYGVKNWYVLGRKATISGEKRDSRRSWMWFIKDVQSQI